MLDVITAKLLRKSGVNDDDSVQKNLCSFTAKQSVIKRDSKP
jgi:hypothetical protein